MILVTGGTGLCGSFLLYELAQKNAKVRALKRESSSLKQVEFVFKTLAGEGGYQNLSDRIEWVNASLDNEENLRHALEGTTEVYHAAAEVNFKKEDAAKVYSTNVAGTALLVNLCLESGVKKFCYFSSIASLNRSSGSLTDETIPDDVPAFSSEYSKTKYQAEMEVWRAMAEGLNALIINPAVILGWGNFSKGSLQVFNTIYKGLPAYPSGSTGYVDVRDVAQFAIRLMEDDSAFGQRYVLVSENILYKDVFTKIALGLNKKPPAYALPKWMAYVASYIWSFIARIKGKNPALTPELVHTSYQHFSFSNKKIIEKTGKSFIPLDATITHACRMYALYKKEYGL